MSFKLAAIFFTSFLLMLLLMPWVIRLAQKHNLTDPVSDEKIHRTAVPRMGGLVLMAAATIACVLFSSVAELSQHLAFWIPALFILFIGLIDDLYTISPLWKLAGEALTLILFWVISVKLQPNPIFNTDFMLYVLLYSLLAFLLINAINLSDGINGLAVSYAFLFFSHQFFIVHNTSALPMAMAGACISFLYFNMIRMNVFLGDCGSLLLGFTLFYLIYSNTATSHTLLNNAIHLLILSLATLAFPIWDMGRVAATRMQQGRSPFAGDLNHLHHWLIQLGLRHWQAVLYLMAGSLLTTLLLTLLLQTKTPLLLPLFIFFAVPAVFSAVVYRFWKRSKQKTVSNTPL